MGQVSVSSAVQCAVDRVFAVATAKESRSLDGVLAAVARDRGRQLVVVEEDLPPGVFGHWIRYPEHDEVAYACWAHTRDRTLAHELGHIMLAHRGRPVAEFAATAVPELSELAALMLRRECGDEAAADEEAAAEQFAGLLLARMHDVGNQDPRLRSRWGEALG